MNSSCVERPRPGMYRYAQYTKPNRYEPQIALTGFHEAKMTSATASQPRPSMILPLAQVPSVYSIT